MLKKTSTIGYAAALATSPAWLSACTTQPAADSAEPSVLFSLTSDAVHLVNVDGANLQIVMEGVDPHAIWFTDRPVRQSGAMTTAAFTSQWLDGGTFAEDPPNAALVLHEPVTTDTGDTTDTLVAEMLEAGYDPTTNTFRADLRVLSDEEAGALEGNLGAHGDKHDLRWPSNADSASLFIDSVGADAVQALAAGGQQMKPAAIKLCSNPSTCNNSTGNYTYNSTIYYSINIPSSVDTSVSMEQFAGKGTERL